MKIGFTGSRAGMTYAQRDALRDLLPSLAAHVLHHGDCLGADAEAHDIARSLGIKVIVHPPSAGALRAYCAGDSELPPLPYLQRNCEIVDATEVLVAAPATASETRRSGTWATVRYARHKEKPVWIINPDGSRGE